MVDPAAAAMVDPSDSGGGGGGHGGSGGGHGGSAREAGASYLVGVAVSSLKADAKAAFFDEEFEKSFDLFSEAIALGHATADLYSDRAKVHIEMGNYIEAVRDCNMALELDCKCCKAYLRKGLAYMKAEIYLRAKDVLTTCLSLGYHESICREMIKLCDHHYITGAETACHGLEQKKKGTPNRLFIIYDERMCKHRPLKKGGECPKRIHEILARLKEKDLLERCGVSASAPPVEREHALAVHEEEYIKFIESLPLKPKDLKAYYKYLPGNSEERNDVLATAGTSQAVFLAAGAVVEACRLVATGSYQSSFAIVRPPGHHARSSVASGFCFLNNSHWCKVPSART